MKTTVTFSAFSDAFRIMRADNFSYAALQALFDYLVDYLEEMEADTGEEIELDVIALCCDYSESDWQEIAHDYAIDLSEADGDEDAEIDLVRDYLDDNTAIVGELPGGVFVYQVF